jgi:hypothetical protein
MFNGKQFLKVIYTVKGKTEAPYVDSTLIDRIVCQLAPYVDTTLIDKTVCQLAPYVDTTLIDKTVCQLAPCVDTTLIHKIVCQLATLHQQLNHSLNFHEIGYRSSLQKIVRQS